MREFIRYTKRNTLTAVAIILGLIVFRSIFPDAYREARLSGLTDILIVIGIPLSLLWDAFSFLFRKKSEEE